MTSGHATSLQHFGRLLGGAARCSAAIATGATAGDMVFELRRLGCGIIDMPGIARIWIHVCVFGDLVCTLYIYITIKTVKQYSNC